MRTGWGQRLTPFEWCLTGVLGTVLALSGATFVLIYLIAVKFLFRVLVG